MPRRFQYFAALLFLLWPGFASAQPPLVFTGIENSSYTEISERVMREAYGRLGIPVSFSRLPAARALVVSNSGKADGELYRIRNIHREYPNLIMIPVPIGVVEGVALTVKPEISLADWDRLRAHRVCIRNGVKFAEAGTRGMEVYIANSNDHLFAMLGKGRCDVIVMARLTSLALAQDFTRRSGKPVRYHLLQTYPLFHYLHRKNEHLVPVLTQVLKAMQADGTIARIRQRYIEEITPGTGA